MQGPFEANDEAAMQALSGLKNVHFVYVCTKRGGDSGGGSGGGDSAAAQ